MTGADFEKLQAWQHAHPGRSIDIKLDYSHELRFNGTKPEFVSEPRVSICVCCAEEGILIEWIGLDEIDHIDEVFRERAASKARQLITDNARLLDRLEAKERAVS